LSGGPPQRECLRAPTGGQRDSPPERETPSLAALVTAASDRAAARIALLNAMPTAGHPGVRGVSPRREGGVRASSSVIRRWPPAMASQANTSKVDEAQADVRP
jgi:hypothetical protein